MGKPSAKTAPTSGTSIIFKLLIVYLRKNTIRDGGTTTLYTAYTAYTVYTVFTVYTVYTVYTVNTVSNV